jgi:hypothetical protein
MAGQAGQIARSSPLSALYGALPSLPMRLREVGRFVAADDYDATTRSMRDLAAEALGGTSAKKKLQDTETRLAATSQYLSGKN